MGRCVSFLVPCIVLFCFPRVACGQFKADAQLRNRFEIRDGYQKLSPAGAVPSVLISQRSRISFSYTTNNIFVKVTPQDVRLWGDDKTVNSTGVPSNTTMGLFEGYAGLKLGNAGWVFAGRQQLVYDSKRLLGDRNWNQNGISYDALVAKLHFGKWDIHGGASWNNITETRSGNFYTPGLIKSLNFLWLNHTFSDNLRASFLHLATGFTETDTTSGMNFRQTSGLYSEYADGIWSFWGNVYYQYGNNRTGTKVNAFLVDADLGRKTGNFTAGVGLGYLSGNRNVSSNRSSDNLFDVFYGNRHKFFGFMDYYRSFATDTKEGGLADYYFYLDYSLSKTLSVRNIGHHFRLAQKNSLTPQNKSLGYENDLIIKYKYNSMASVECGWIYYLPTHSLQMLQNIPGAPNASFVYVQLTVTPVLYQGEKE